LLEGQAHHPRGGFGTLMKLAEDERRERLQGQLGGDADLVVAPLGAERRARIDALYDAAPRRHPADVAYWLYSGWRPPLFQGPYLAISRHRRLVFPMMDERVLAASARLATGERQSEAAFFAAMRALAPALGALPLYDNV